MECSITQGITIGASGGAIAGAMVYLIQQIHNAIIKSYQISRVEKWLRANTSEEPGNRYRSTRAIASHNNLTQDRVRFICSHSEMIFLSTGTQDDMWSLYKEE